MADRDVAGMRLTEAEIERLEAMAKAAEIMDEHDEEGADGDERAADQSH